MWRVVCDVRARSFVCDHVRARRGRRGRRGHVVAVAVASLDVAVARRGRGCGVRRLCVAVVRLRHADEC